MSREGGRQCKFFAQLCSAVRKTGTALPAEDLCLPFPVIFSSSFGSFETGIVSPALQRAPLEPFFLLAACRRESAAQSPGAVVAPFFFRASEAVRGRAPQVK